MITALHGDVETARSAIDKAYGADEDLFAMSVWAYYHAMAASMAGDPRWAMWAAERWIAAGADRSGVAAADRPDAAASALDRADHALTTYGQRYAEGLLLLLRARLLHARGEPVDVVRAAAEAARARSDERGAHLFARRSERFLAEIDREPPDI